MPKTVPQSLISKLAEACNAVGGVEKKGRNDFQRYDYVKAADVAKAIRHELFQRGILVLIDEKEWAKISDLTTNSGNSIPLMQLKAEVIFRDENSSINVNAFATAFDTGDKAIYKAKTGLLKYALRGLGLIPDEKDDPEFDESVDEQTDPRAVSGGENKKDRKKHKQVAEYQVRAFNAACSASGKTAQQVADYLRARWSCASVAELPQEEFKDAIKWATGTEDLEKTLETSKQALPPKKPQPINGGVDDFDQRIAGD